MRDIKFNANNLKKKSVRITQIDGKLPNIALMKLSHWHKSNGDKVYFTKSVKKELFEDDYDIVYGSTIFNFSSKKTDLFKKEFPNAIIGGTGSDNKKRVEDIINLERYECFDYDLYPEYKNSIGFSQRGCRLACKFCVVPNKEGKNKNNDSITNIWRGSPYPKNIVLLDNDFFGQPDWQKKADEIIKGDFKINFSQGINIRLIDDSGCQALKSIKYRDTNFSRSRIYTAWDNIGDEKIFMRGVDRMVKHGIPTNHILVYMIIGFKKGETMDDIFYRFNKLNDLGCLPYPMVFDMKNKTLKKFARWVIRGLHNFVKWEDYSSEGRAHFNRNKKQSSSQLSLI